MNYYHHHVNDNGEEHFFGAISDDGKILFRTDDPTEYAAAKVAYSSTDNKEDAEKLYEALIDRYLSLGDEGAEEKEEEEKEEKECHCDGSCAACSCHDREDDEEDEEDDDDDDWKMIHWDDEYELDDEDDFDLPPVRGFLVELTPWDLISAAAVGVGAFTLIRRLFRR